MGTVQGFFLYFSYVPFSSFPKYVKWKKKKVVASVSNVFSWGCERKLKVLLCRVAHLCFSSIFFSLGKEIKMGYNCNWEEVKKDLGRVRGRRQKDEGGVKLLARIRSDVSPLFFQYLFTFLP